MHKKLKTIGGILLLGCLLLIAMVAFRGEKWDKYYKNKIYQPPQEAIQTAAYSFENPGKAIDLGCGVGNEAAFLLRNGWAVWAIDNQPKAIQMLKARNDIGSLDELVTLTAKFDEGLKWEDLPSVDFLYASYALPFCQPKEFESVWNHIRGKILPGGRFAGHFFGFNYQGFAEREKAEMTFLTSEEIHNLFKDFNVEHFREYEEDGKSGTGRSIHSHIFEIIAKKWD